jgi:RecA/RadA recombinase
MAKKTEKKVATFSDLNDALSKFSPDGDILENSVYARIDEFIGTGSFILNAALSGSLFGGMPNRRSLTFAGVEGSGKTYLALSICRNAQAMGYNIVYYDSEGGIDIDFVKRLGVDTTKFRIENISTIEQFAHLTAKLNEQMNEWRAKGINPPKVMVVLDSLGNLSSTKEKEDTTEGSGKRDMTKQQAIRRTFRVVGNDFAKNAVPFIICNHVYECILGNTEVILEDGSSKEIKDIIIGERVLTLGGPKEVTDKFDYDVKNLLELKFADDYIIKCTPDHKFMVEGKNGEIKWVRAGDLEETDEILLE